jgi:hypothetical protein
LTIVALELFALGEPLAGSDSRQLLEQFRIIHGDEIHGNGRVVVGAGRDVLVQVFKVDAWLKERATA